MKTIGILTLVCLTISACNPATTPVAPATALTATQALPSTPVPISTYRPTPTTVPTQTPNPFPNPFLKLTGKEEIVFDWTTDRCAQYNIPDLAARAFRDASNQVHLLLSHYVNYQMVGPDLNQLTSDCQPILKSQFASDPAQYADADWVASPYTEDGKTVYALVHDEYQGHTHPGKCPSGNYFDCLDTSLTLFVSTDSGNMYTAAAKPPAHLVTTLPYTYVAGAGPFGLRTPSNIIKAKDGYYYSFSKISRYNTQDQGVCLMRTTDLSDPASWRFWNGSGFDGKFINPYVDPLDDRISHDCAKLASNDIGASLNDSITYNTYLKRYVLIGLSADQISTREVWGIYHSFSVDLIHWTHRKLLAQMPLPWTVKNSGTDLSILYPALLDSNSESRNFETTGKTAYVYYTRHNFGQGSLDRDLVRVAVEFFPSP